MTGLGWSTHTPVNSPSLMLSEEAEYIHWFPGVNCSGIVPQFATVTLGKGEDVT